MYFRVPVEFTLVALCARPFGWPDYSTLPKYSEFKDSTIRQNQLLGLSHTKHLSVWSRRHIRLLEESVSPECIESELSKKRINSKERVT